jgi:hypothetical protein
MSIPLSSSERDQEPGPVRHMPGPDEPFPVEPSPTGPPEDPHPVAPDELPQK